MDGEKREERYKSGGGEKKLGLAGWMNDGGIQRGGNHKVLWIKVSCDRGNKGRYLFVCVCVCITEKHKETREFALSCSCLTVSG